MTNINLEENVEMIVTGGMGFIGSNFIRFISTNYPNVEITNIDALTYSGNKNNLADIKTGENYRFINKNICDQSSMEKLISPNSIVVNFAAESHVDNSLVNSQPFIMSNVYGTNSLLQAARIKKARLFIQISTDEVYGSLSHAQESSKETDILRPSSPYSASKAAAEMLCFSSLRSFNQPIIITRSSNNFGPYQFPEKVIPLFITNILEEKKVPLYGNGKNVRDWIYVQDNCRAISTVIQKGKIGEIYNIGGGNELQNIDLTERILKNMGKDSSFIQYVKDRPGHDIRYSLNCSKIKELGWEPILTFDEALSETIIWYKNNINWWRPLRSR